RLGKSVTEIITKHEYPDVIARLLAEAMTLNVVLGGMLKYEGIFTLQAHGDGPASLLVSDLTSQGNLRGYVQFNEEKLNNATIENSLDLLGEGRLVFTVD